MSHDFKSKIEHGQALLRHVRPHPPNRLIRGQERMLAAGTGKRRKAAHALQAGRSTVFRIFATIA